MIEVSGRAGQIKFDGQWITITRNGFMARSIVGKGEKRLHVSQISAVQWKPAGFTANGFIQFTIPGGNEVKSRFGNQSQAALKDENSVVFTKSQQPAFEQLRAAIDQAIAQQHAPQQAAPSSIADELGKLGQLLQQGLITAQDYETAKARVLGT